MKKNTQKFVHYVMVSFTYGVGVGTAGLIVFTLITAIKEII